MSSWSRPVALGELGSQGGGGQHEGPSWGSWSHSLIPSSSGKEEALCRLQEENRRLSREQERVSRADRRQDRQPGSRSEGIAWGVGGAELPGPGADSLARPAVPTAGRQAVVSEHGWAQAGLRGTGAPGD